MKQYTFLHRPPLYKRIFFTLVEIILGISFSALTLFGCFLGLEWYFKNYYLSIQNIPQTAMNLPIFQESPFRSWDHTQNTDIDFGIGTPTPKIHINSIGLRNDEIEQNKKRKTILMLGDSFVFGMGVDQKQTYPAYLQKMLGTKYTQVVNAGVIGQTIDDAFMYLKHEGIKMNPKIVVFNFFVGNDITELRRHEWQRDDKEYITSVKDMVLHADKDHHLRFRESKAPDSYFLYWIENKINQIKMKYGYASPELIDPTLTWPVFLPPNHPFQDQNLDEYWGKFAETLDQMNKYCKANNIAFMVNIVPMDTQVSKQYWKKYPGGPFNEESYKAERPQKRFAGIAKNLGVAYFDPLPQMQDIEKTERISLYFTQDPHLNPLGTKYLAAFLWRYLQDTYF